MHVDAAAPSKGSDLKATHGKDLGLTLPDGAVNTLDALLRILWSPERDVRAAAGPVFCAAHAWRHAAVY